MLSTPCALTVGASLATAAPTVDTTFLVNQRRQKWGGPLLRHTETGRRWMGKAVKALVEVCQLAIADRRLDKQPHRNYKYIQLTSNTDCNSNVGCVIAHTEVKGKSFGWSVGVSVDGWISGGFEVTEYAESGEVRSCQGETGEVICVFWHAAAYTAYTVSVEDLCALEPTFEMVISSPNVNGLVSTYLCANIISA